MSEVWHHCCRCKTPIRFGATYWICSVSTCNRVRNPMYFCSMDCWDAHLPVARHREAWAEELTAPPSSEKSPTPATPPSESSRDSNSSQESRSSSGQRRIVGSKSTAANLVDDELDREILIVASKLKAYVRAKSGLNTSATVIEVLSTKVRRLCDQAIARAKAAQRQTLLDRDFESKDI